MAQEIVTPLNLSQAVEEIKQYIDDNGKSARNIKLRIKNEVIKADGDQQYTINNDNTYTSLISRKAKNIKIQNLIYSNKLTIGDWEQYNWGDTIDRNDISDYSSYDSRNLKVVHFQYHFSNVTNIQKLNKLIKNNIFCIFGIEDEESGEIVENPINIKELQNDFYIAFDEEIDDYLHLYVTISLDKLLNKLSNVVYFKFLPVLILGTSGNGKEYNSLIILNSELWITDESGTITSETESKYYLYIERWNSKKQKWSVYMDHLGIQPIKFSDMEKHVSEYGGNVYYKLPFDAYTILDKLKKIGKNPNLTIQIGIATDFQYDSIENETYVNPRLINKLPPITVKVYGHRFPNTWLNDNNNDNWLKTDLIQMRFTTNNHRFYYKK